MAKPCLDHGRAGNHDGYHRVRYMGKSTLLHRKVFHQIHGYLPEVVMHICDNPRCVEPTHLVAGTRDSNNKDRAAKGRSAKHRPDKRTLTREQVLEIRARYSPKRCKYNGVSALAREFGVDTNTIYQIIRGHTYRDIT